MVTIKVYLDKRALRQNREAPLKVAFTKKGDTALMPLGVKVLPSQWDEKAQKVVSHPAKDALNAFIRNRMVAVQNLILSLTTAGELVSLSATQVKNKVASLLDPEVEKENLFVSWFEKHIARQENRRTREIYQATLKKLQSYDRMIGKLSFEEIGKAWLTDFDTWLAENGCPGRNSRNIHLRNIRAVFNEAIDNEVTMAYPFRKFKIKPEQTAKRNLSVGSLRQLFDYPVEDWQRRYVDFFKLTFFLIGINTVDLLACRPSDLTEGRLRYKRAKTGRIYNIKVEPEAADLIGQYHGNDLLVSFGEGITNYHNFTGKCDKGLKSIGTVEQVENPKWKEGSRKHRYVTKRNSAFPGLSIYWARHSWATIAASLDIPKETIAAALGHGGNTVTDIYIDFDQKKVDDANRKVIDWVLYGKR